VDRNLLGKKIVLDEDDVEPGPSPAVDNPPHSCKQLPGVEGVRKRGIALEKALEQVDDDDSAAGAHCIVSLPTSLLGMVTPPLYIQQSHPYDEATSSTRARSFAVLEVN